MFYMLRFKITDFRLRLRSGSKMSQKSETYFNTSKIKIKKLKKYERVRYNS